MWTDILEESVIVLVEEIALNANRSEGGVQVIHHQDDLYIKCFTGNTRFVKLANITMSFIVNKYVMLKVVVNACRCRKM